MVNTVYMQCINSKDTFYVLQSKLTVIGLKLIARNVFDANNSIIMYKKIDQNKQIVF